MSHQQELEQRGYTLLTGVISAEKCTALIERLTNALNTDAASVLRSRGETYGSRDLISLLPEVCEIPRHTTLKRFVTAVLGNEAGLVRVLYFDKPPNRGWSLPWHKDDTIAVKDNRLPSTIFRRPTLKAGIPHVNAPDSFLRTMLTMRLHLDPMTSENGPLSVIPGSHSSDSPGQGSHVEIHAAAGDMLVMRPLLTHASSQPKEGTTRHRRIIHFELAESPHLDDGFEWHDFHPIQ
jgi:ectoine hydroxylase-related dioxygenase (phytanoyl-CoA dioxygenase family)